MFGITVSTITLVLVMSQKQDALISDLLALSLKSVRAKSMKVKQLTKMQAGKVRKALKDTEIKYY